MNVVHKGVRGPQTGWIAAMAAASACLLGTAGFAGAEQAEGSKRVLKYGVSIREVMTHMGDYRPGAYLHFWEFSSLVGVTGEVLYRKDFTAGDKSLYWDAGGGLGFLVGTYDYESTNEDGQGAGVFAVEFNFPFDVGYYVNDDLNVFGRLGLAVKLMFYGKADNAMAPYGDDFDEQTYELYMALGAEFDVTPKLSLSVDFRFTLWGLGGEADYQWDGWFEEVSDLGLQISVVSSF